MTARPELTDEELSAMWAYLRTVPAIDDALPSPAPEAPIDPSDAGRVVFHKYGCHACHGDDDGGIHDLRAAAARYPDDESLIAYIKHPELTKPGVGMPTWDGTIEESEYAPLARFVRSLSLARATGAARSEARARD